MKKLVVLLTILLIVNTSLVVNASGQRGGNPKMNQGQNRTTAFTEETLRNKENVTTHNNTFFAKREENQVRRLEKAQEKWENRFEKRDAWVERYLLIVKEYAPDLFDDYTSAYARLEEIKTESIEIRTLIAKTFMEETQEGLEEDMTKEEIRSYMFERREAFKALFAEYQEAIAEDKEAYQASKELADDLKEALEIAIEEDNEEEIENLLRDLYDNLVEHLTYEESKLEALEKLLEKIQDEL